MNRFLKKTSSRIRVLFKKNDWIWKLNINVIVFPVNLPLRQKHRFNTLIFMFLYYSSRCSVKLHVLKSIKIITTNLWYFLSAFCAFYPHRWQKPHTFKTCALKTQICTNTEKRPKRLVFIRLLLVCRCIL